LPLAVVNSSGKSIVTEEEKSDSRGFKGQPASEIEETLISTFSPAVIGISIWLILGVSPF
jgi:hypothetical protein